MRWSAQALDTANRWSPVMVELLRVLGLLLGELRLSLLTSRSLSDRFGGRKFDA